MLIARPLLVLMSAVFVSTVTAQLLNDIFKRMSSEREVEFCPLDPSVKTVYCTNSDGDPVTPEDGRIPVMSACVMETEHGDTNTITCLQIGINVKTIHLTSEKRLIPGQTSIDLRRKRVVGEVIVGAIFCLFLCGGGHHRNKPPVLTCAGLVGSNPVITKKGELDAIVSWTAPSAYDQEDGDIHRGLPEELMEVRFLSGTQLQSIVFCGVEYQDRLPFANSSVRSLWGNPRLLYIYRVNSVPASFISGKRYPAGHYSVTFYAQDNSGGADQCSLTFQVEVITCGHPGWPKNGRLECQDHFTAYGRGCNIVCDEGYGLTSGSVKSIECTDSKTWDNQIPDCKPVECKPKPSLPHGHIQCPKGAFFNKLCGVVCDDGYSISRGYFVECDKQGHWKDAIPQCKDIQPPVFTYCPDPIQVLIDAANNTAYVEWDKPEGHDNSGAPTITERNGKKPGRYEAGTQVIVYDITDADGNSGQSCVFAIIVQTISCDPPDLDIEQGKEHIKYFCPDLYRFGAECSLACESGYPLVGETTINCKNVGNSNPPDLQWTWDRSGLKPYCKVSRCSDLDPPANGAIACDLWEYGNACQMQCQDGFDIPILPQGGGLFVCSTTDGNWIPSTEPPDCVAHVGPSGLKMGADFYYYTGVCNSSAENLMEIQENFINALNSSAYKAICVGHEKCQSRFVSVVCGPVKTLEHGKRNARSGVEEGESETVGTIKDEVAHNIDKRQTGHVYKIYFELIVSIKIGCNSTTSEATTDTEHVLSNMINAIKTEIAAGKFAIAGLEVKDNSLDVGTAEPECDPGMEAREQTKRCVGCGYGRFYNSSTSDCALCPIGTYQDQAHALSCISCPNNSTTLYSSTKNISQCLSYCEPGEYSATGISPCAKCPSNKYQPGYRQTNCTACPAMKRSEVMGATEEQQCQVYDVQLKFGKPVNVRNITKSSKVVSIVTWLYMISTSGRQTLTSLVSSDKTFNMSILYDTEIIVDIGGREEVTGMQLQPHKWTQLAVAVDSDLDTVTVYSNGNAAHTANSFTIPRGVAPADRLVVDADVQLSSYQMTSSLLTLTDLQTWSSTCHFAVSETFISIDDLAKSQNANSVVPSKCDAVDECLSSPCGSHGVCTNLHGGYQCTCTGGYTGNTCTERPDPCISNICQNCATCTNRATNYTCVCPYGYSGDLCEIKALDGKMSAWSDWSKCSRSCERGFSSRSRACDSPAPDPEGKPCNGNTTETKDCNVGVPCPECLSLRRPLGATDVVCNETETLKRCEIQCQGGYELPEDSPTNYECGAATNYTWSHQTDDNPRARLPACSAVIAPVNLGYTSTSKYSNLTCQDESVVLQQLSEKLQSMPCASSTLCFQTITTSCSTETNTGPLYVTISIKSGTLPSGINIQEFFDNSTVSDKFEELVQTIYNVETTTQKMLNDTSNFFNVAVNGGRYSTTERVNASNHISCKPGSAPFSALCVESPVGAYSDGLTVIMCSRGTYQNDTGSTSCKPCPSGFTTLEVGAESVDECSVTVDRTVTNSRSLDQSPHFSSQKNSDNAAVIIGSVIGGLVVLIGIGIGIVIGMKLARNRKRPGEQSVQYQVQNNAIIKNNLTYFKSSVDQRSDECGKTIASVDQRSDECGKTIASVNQRSEECMKPTVSLVQGSEECMKTTVSLVQGSEEYGKTIVCVDQDSDECRKIILALDPSSFA